MFDSVSEIDAALAAKLAEAVKKGRDKPKNGKKPRGKNRKHSNLVCCLANCNKNGQAQNLRSDYWRGAFEWDGEWCISGEGPLDLHKLLPHCEFREPGPVHLASLDELFICSACYQANTTFAEQHKRTRHSVRDSREISRLLDSSGSRLREGNQRALAETKKARTEQETKLEECKAELRELKENYARAVGLILKSNRSP